MALRHVVAREYEYLVPAELGRTNCHDVGADSFASLREFALSNREGDSPLWRSGAGTGAYFLVTEGSGLDDKLMELHSDGWTLEYFSDHYRCSLREGESGTMLSLYPRPEGGFYQIESHWSYEGADEWQAKLEEGQLKVMEQSFRLRAAEREPRRQMLLPAFGIKAQDVSPHERHPIGEHRAGAAPRRAALQRRVHRFGSAGQQLRLAVFKIGACVLAVVAVEAPRTVWYTEIPLTDDASQHITMGSEFCGTFSETDNEAVNAVCAWFREVCTREE